jgi:hypothetical protein
MKDVTVEVLREIRSDLGGVRDEIAGLRAETKSELREVRLAIEATNERVASVERRQAETEVRLATEIVAVAGAVRDLRDVLVADREMRTQVADHEGRIQKLERRTGSSRGR